MSLPLHAFLLFLHIGAVVIWVGGMFFAYVCLRPAVMAVLGGPEDAPLRLRLWTAVFERFLPIVWGLVFLLAASGGTLLARVGMDQAPKAWHLMLTLGLVMIGVFAQVYFGPYRALRRHVQASEWPAAGQALGRIRTRIGLNLLLALATIASATLGLAF